MIYKAMVQASIGFKLVKGAIFYIPSFRCYYPIKTRVMKGDELFDAYKLLIVQPFKAAFCCNIG